MAAAGVLHVRRVVIELPGRGQVVKPYPKGGASSRRAVGLPDSLLAALEVFSAGRGSGAPLWVSDAGGRQWYGSAQRRLRTAMAAAGIDGSGFHTLRRTAATLALQQSASVRDVQAMLGHASPLMTLTRYAQPDVSQQRAATGRVADAILTVAPGQNPDNRPIDAASRA